MNAAKTPTTKPAAAAVEEPAVEAAEVPAPKKAAAKKPAGKSAWTSLVTKPESAPKDVIDEPKAAPTARTTTTKTYNVTRPVKKAATYRLPQDALDLIEAEISAEAEAGNRLTKDDAVTRALRATYGKKHAARIRDRD